MADPVRKRQALHRLGRPWVVNGRVSPDAAASFSGARPDGRHWVGQLPYSVHRHDALTSGFVGAVTRWSCAGREPPPLRPLVSRAPRAEVQAPDQQFLVLRLFGDAGFAGGFLGALSNAA